VEAYLAGGPDATGIALGRPADRTGRTATTSDALAISAGCGLARPRWCSLRRPPVLVALLLVWGAAAVIADPAQFPAAVTELADPRHAGSVLLCN